MSDKLNKTKINFKPVFSDVSLKKKYCEISGQILTVQEECENITDEQIQDMMIQSSYYGYTESYA
jgi:hypothetical protein